ncbi:MAG: glutamate racemase [Bacilli bacterium]|nr:glutamate racemase [Bacilli bacterium]
MDNRPICFFDSGIGGATILREVVKLLPNEGYIYYADSINNPYGEKSKEELFGIVDNVVKNLLEYNPKIIVCACNTATAMVLTDIRAKYPDIVFIGTEPAVKVVFDNYKDKKSIVLTTKGTGESEKFLELFHKYETDNCTLVPAPELANLIENNKDTSFYLSNLLKEYVGTEVVVLGCTHFPLVEDEIKNVLGDVLFVDGSIGIANRINSLIKKNNGHGFIKIISTDRDVEDRILNIIGK